MMQKRAVALMMVLMLIPGIVPHLMSVAPGFPIVTSAAMVPPGAFQATLETPITQTPAPPAATATPQPVPATVNGVEPGEISRETGGALSIYGAGFAPGIAIRLVRYGLLDAAVLNPNAIRAVVPPGLNEGTYDLEVILPDGAVQTVSNALRIRSKSIDPTATSTYGPSLAFNQPQLLIAFTSTDPETLRPGETFSLNMELINRGDVTATNIRVALTASDIAVPVGGSSLSVIDKLKSGETARLALTLALSDKATAGFHNLAMELNYTDYYRREFSSQQSIGVSVSNKMASQPIVLLKGYRTEPEALSPGDTFTLKIEMTNAGQRDAQQVLLTLGGKDGVGLGPFAILGSGNIQFVPRLSPGAVMEVEQHLILDGAANAGVFSVPVTLGYDDPAGEHITGTQVLNLVVSRRPQLKIDYYHPLEIGKIDQPIELPIELINIGRNTVNVSIVNVSCDAGEIDNNKVFIGALDGGTSGTVDVTVTPKKSGTHSVLVTVNYLDDFNQPKVMTAILPLVVEEKAVVAGAETAAAANAEGGNSFWDRLGRFFRGLLGLGS